MMKAKITLIALFLAILSNLDAQEINGKILINQAENIKIELKGQEVVHLYAQLRERDFSINFNFDGNKLPMTNDGKQVSLIQFKTTVKHNGREIKSINRNPMPFFPGSMFMPIETFDLISILTIGDDPKGAVANKKLAPGTYVVRFEAISLDATGNIKPAVLHFDVK